MGHPSKSSPRTSRYAPRHPGGTSFQTIPPRHPNKTSFQIIPQRHSRIPTQEPSPTRKSKAPTAKNNNLKYHIKNDCTNNNCLQHINPSLLCEHSTKYDYILPQSFYLHNKIRKKSLTKIYPMFPIYTRIMRYTEFALLLAFTKNSSKTSPT